MMRGRNNATWLEAGFAKHVDEFWRLAGELEPFPRRLTGPASLALPLVVRELSPLTLDDIRLWLATRNITNSLEDAKWDANRRLRGCLLAYRGSAFVLVDSSDPDDEKRFTVAHELAHFLLDYWEPRLRSIATLGEDIIPALDGLRPPTRTERLHAILSTMSLGLHMDLMERTSSGGYTSQATLVAEERADRLALELLAPTADAWVVISEMLDASNASNTSTSYASLHKHSTEIFCQRYGLPEEQARPYSAWLLKKGGHSPGFRDWLGLGD